MASPNGEAMCGNTAHENIEAKRRSSERLVYQTTTPELLLFFRACLRRQAFILRNFYDIIGL